MTKIKLKKYVTLTLAVVATGITLGLGLKTNPVTAQTPPITQTSVQPDVQKMQVSSGLPIWVYPIGGIVLIMIFLPNIGWIAGLIVIGEREVGIITKKFAAKNLPPGRLIAFNGEAGLQADTLPPGWHFCYFPWQYNVQKEAVVIIPQDEIGLIVANDGAAIPPDRILGKVVTESDNFQNARSFLTKGGEKGRQLTVLTTGTYRINTALFQVITSKNATAHGMTPEQLRVHTIKPDHVGIVTTLDGLPIEEGEIAGPIIPGHNNFQNVQTFMNGGGRRGLQEQVILSGSWNLNPWFVKIEQVPMTEVPIGYVGVVISYVGQSHGDVSGESFTHGNLVKKGDKGVWIESLPTGKHPLNTKIMKVELVPTTNIVLNFTARFKGEHGYDSSLSALKLLSFDGFTFDLEVFQIIHVGAMDAPKVISRLGSMQNLVDQVLRPIVGNYFRNSAQEYTILDFLTARSERQAEAAEYVRQALRAYDVQAVDTLIGLISPPPELMQTLTDRKIAEEQEKTYLTQRNAQTQRQELVRETALADIQQQVVKAEEGVKIAKLEASAAIEKANGEAESIRLTGDAKADAYQAGVQSLGIQSYTALQLMQVIGDRHVRVVPDVAVTGNNNGSGLVDAMMGMFLLNQNQTPESKNGNSSTLSKHKLLMTQKIPDLHSYCFNPRCQWPENPHNNLFCDSCGANLLLCDRYRGLQLLGKGGSGQTFLVLDFAQNPANLCVIKQTWGQFPSYFSPEVLLKLFHLQEQNAQCPKYLDQFEQNGVFYQVQEYILGDNLAKILTEKITFNTQEIWQVLTSLLPVLDYIHSCDIIHYDLKPENIINRDSLENLVLVDIGGFSPISSKSIPQGNAVYTAPEQLRGKIFFASDLYSLGVTCIHLLTGIHPFNLFDFAENKWIWQNYWLSDTNNTENQHLAQFLDRLIAPSLEKRFSSAKEAITELEKLIEHKTQKKYNFTQVKKKENNHKLSEGECYETLIGHQGLFASVNAVAIAPNDKILASGSDDKTIRLWELPTGKQCFILHGHNNFVKSVEFHPVEENILISGSSDRTIKIWDLATRSLIKTLTGHNHTVNRVIFSPDGQIIASGSNDKTVMLWNYETGEIITYLKGHKLGVTDIAFCPNIKLLASGSTDTNIQIWDLNTFESIDILKGHTGSVKTITFSPNGQILATGGEDRTIRIWDVNKRECMRILSGHPWPVSCLKFSLDGKILISSSWDKTVKLWEVRTGEEIGNLIGHTDSVNSVQISTEQNIIVTGSKDQTVKLWKVLSVTKKPGFC